MSSHALAEIAVGLRVHAPGATEQVEVVDVGRAEIDLQRLEQVRQRHALRLRLDAIDLQVELRHVGLVAGERKAHARRSHHGALQRRDRFLESAEADARAILDEQRIAGAGAEAENRRWIDHEGEPFLDRGHLGLDLGGDLLRAAMALVERLQDREGRAVVWRIRLLRGIEAGHRDHVRDTVRGEGGVPDLPHHVGRASDRRSFRQLDPGDQIELVLRRDKAARHAIEHDAGAAEQQRVDGEHQASVLEDASHRSLVPVGAGLEEAVERTEQPAERPLDEA